METNPVISLGGRQIRLTAPKSAMVCHEIAAIVPGNQHRAAIAALMVCWPPEAPPKGKNRRERRKNRKDQQERAKRLDQVKPRLKRPRILYTGQPLSDAGNFADALLKQGQDCGFDYAELVGVSLHALALVLGQVTTISDLEDVEDDFFDDSEEPAEE